jgi:hypothetical protein
MWIRDTLLPAVLGIEPGNQMELRVVATDRTVERIGTESAAPRRIMIPTARITQRKEMLVGVLLSISEVG